jgi:hypothetical protein
MALQAFYIQSTGGGCFVSAAVPQASAPLYSQGISSNVAQQWIPAQYPGTDPTNVDGVVCVLYSAESVTSTSPNTPTLVISASSCGAACTLEPFQQGNLYQLWAYKGTGQATTCLNLGNGCMLDLANGDCSGGAIQTYQANNTSSQSWTMLTPVQAAASAAQVSERDIVKETGA